jgi:hypothetical protein
MEGGLSHGNPFLLKTAPWAMTFIPELPHESLLACRRRNFHGHIHPLHESKHKHRNAISVGQFALIATG